MEQIGIFFNQVAAVCDRMLVKGLIYITFGFIGILLSYLYIKTGLGGVLISTVKTNIIQFYKVIGHAFWGLLPLTGCLFYLFTRDALSSAGLGYGYTKPKLYLMIKENAPLIGIGGTMEGVAIGISSMDLNAGVEVAYNSLKLAIGNAVYSSLWGIIIVLFINLVVPMVNPKWSGFLEEQGKRLKSIDYGVNEMIGLVRVLQRIRKKHLVKKEDV